MHGKVLTDQNSTRNSDGKPYLTGVGAGAFFRFTRLKTTRLLPISEINYLRLTSDFYRCKNSNTFHEIRCITSRYKNSFFPDAIISWNNIITNLQNVPSFTSLKAHIRFLVRPKGKSTFGVHDPLGLRFHFQLRVDLSPLINHKRRYNFADTPSGICECNQEIEGTSHFLFECPRYATERANLAFKVIVILQRNNLNHLGNQLELYLYGHRSLNPIDNRNILLSTIEYIKDTQWFLSKAPLPPPLPTPCLLQS